MKTISELLGQLIQKAYECKTHHVFIEYSPHVELVTVRIYWFGWRSGDNSDKCFQIYLEEKKCCKRIERNNQMH